jgi:hypothetical protein
MERTSRRRRATNGHRAGAPFTNTLGVKRMRHAVSALVLSVASTASAATGVVYREPHSFSELPPTFAIILTKEGCRVPQGTIDGKVVAPNVVSGAFASKGQTDWAVLCAKGGHQYIRVLWGGAARCSPRINKGRVLTDAEIKQGLEFDRALDRVDRKFIVEHYEAYGGPKPPAITHLGINYAFLEKASVVHYCHKGRWMELTGAD